MRKSMLVRYCYVRFVDMRDLIPGRKMLEQFKKSQREICPFLYMLRYLSLVKPAGTSHANQESKATLARFRTQLESCERICSTPYP